MTNIFNHHLHCTTPHGRLTPSSIDNLQQRSAQRRAGAERPPPPPFLALSRLMPQAASGVKPLVKRLLIDRGAQRPFPRPLSHHVEGTSGHLHKGQPAPPIESANTGGSEPRPETERPLGGVRQDKARLESARIASRQPALDIHVSRAQLTNNKVVRSQSVAGKQKLVQVTLWVDPAVKERLERRAREEGLSLSPAGAAFLRKAVQQDIDLQYSALLRPIIEDAIARQMAGIATRLTWLLVRIAFDAGQTRSLVTNILGRQQGVSQPLLKTILDASGRSAKANIMRRTHKLR